MLSAIQERLGLAFDQFIRAVLLAQNEFTAFLHADDNARAELLELLTGTEMFSELSTPRVRTLQRRNSRRSTT